MTCDSPFALTPHPGRTAVGFHHYQHPFYESESEPYYGRPLPSVPHSIPNWQRKLTDERLKCDKNLGWSIDWATAFVVDHLDRKNSPEAGDTLRKVVVRASQLAQEGQWKQVVYRAFNVLNKTVFAGQLQDAVYLNFGRLGQLVSGATFAHGYGPSRRVQRISMILNTDILQNMGGPYLISSLIHHMIHAYFLVACGPEKETEREYGRLDHGLPFSKVMSAIREVAQSQGKMWLPGLDMSHRLHRQAAYNGYHPRAWLKPQDDWHHSHCPIDMELASDGDVEKWYSRVCKPLSEMPDAAKSAKVFIYNRRDELEQVPRAETTPSSESAEFLFQDKAVLVPFHKIDEFPSIRKAFDRQGHRYMEIPEEVSSGTFMAFLELLHTGSYSPNIDPVSSATGRGPLIIKSTRPSSPPYLARDINMFKMGAEMHLDDLMGISLSRMRAQCVTHEDPIQILQAVYEGGDPHADLRQWAKEFLIAGPTRDKIGEWGNGGLLVGRTASSAAEMEPPNLVKLKTELCFRERFAELVERCGALHIDVLKAEEMLVASGRVPVSVAGLGSMKGLLASAYGLGGLSPSMQMQMPLGLSAAAAAAAARQLALGMASLPEVGRLGWGDEGVSAEEYARHREEMDAALYAARYGGVGMGDDRWC